MQFYIEVYRLCFVRHSVTSAAVSSIGVLDLDHVPLTQHPKKKDKERVLEDAIVMRICMWVQNNIRQVGLKIKEECYRLLNKTVSSEAAAALGVEEFGVALESDRANFSARNPPDSGLDAETSAVLQKWFLFDPEHDSLQGAVAAGALSEEQRTAKKSA